MTKKYKKPEKIVFSSIHCHNCETRQIEGLWHHSPFCLDHKPYRKRILDPKRFNMRKVIRQHMKSLKYMEYDLIEYNNRDIKHTIRVKKQARPLGAFETIKNRMIDQLGISTRGLTYSYDYDGHTFVILRRVNNELIPVFIVNKKTLHNT